MCVCFFSHTIEKMIIHELICIYRLFLKCAEHRISTKCSVRTGRSLSPIPFTPFNYRAHPRLFRPIRAPRVALLRSQRRSQCDGGKWCGRQSLQQRGRQSGVAQLTGRKTFKDALDTLGTEENSEVQLAEVTALFLKPCGLTDRFLR